jgi:hypothetical protein
MISHRQAREFVSPALGRATGASMSAIAPVSEVSQDAATAVVHPSASVPPADAAGAAPVPTDAASIAASAAYAATASISPAHQDSAPLFQRIEEAVVLAIEVARESTTPPGSTSSVAVNIAIQNAIESVLSGGDGLTSRGTVSQPQAAASETPSATTDPTAATATTAPPASAAANPQNPLDPNAAAQTFFTLLEENGVAPREFQKDFQIAFQHATAAGGAILPSLATPRSLAGSFIDTTG